MKKLRRILFLALMVGLLACLCCQPAFAAVTEEEVQAQVDAVGKEAVSGNVLIWFMCAIGFLKVSQKIDSFMASLGVNVGHTGGSMLAEAMIAARGFSGFKSGGLNSRPGLQWIQELFQPLFRRWAQQQFHPCECRRWW